MTTIRVKKDERYFSASNEPFNDERLSWEARGLMGYLLSKPNNWIIRQKDLEKKGPAGEHKLRRMLAELRKYGYMNRIRVIGEGGLIQWETEIYESPSHNPNPNAKVTTRRLSTSGSSTSGKPQDLINTDAPSTNEPKEPSGASAKPLKANQIPQIILFRSITNKYPSKGSQFTVITCMDKVGDRLGREAVADDLLPFYREWCDRGYNPVSVKWLSDWAVPGFIPQNGNGHKPTEPRGVTVARSWLEKKEMENYGNA